MTGDSPLLSVSLSVDYPRKPGVLRNACLSVARGETVALVGQSGSGKSTLALALLRLLDVRGAQVRGRLRFDGRDLLAASEREMRRIRGREIGLVLQSALSSLNPLLPVGIQLREAWLAHCDRQGSAAERRERWNERLAQVLREVSLPAEAGFVKLYPSELSVGLAQRVLIAMAVLHRPALLIADEPTSALDVITQAEILRLFSELNQRHGTAILFISHDLLSVASLCHRAAILKDGEIVETNSTSEIFQRPRHPYTRDLIAALPQLPAGRCLEGSGRPCP
ncbi:MAG: ABC transporter ATP-binding protein [Acidobacteria bacterium]|nr:ABC transporter ATP-binding protein [Acidobacteriota bacterium]